MKLILSLLLVFSLCNTNNRVQEHKKVLFLFYQQEKTRPIANDYAVFWNNKQYFDTVSIHGTEIVNRIENNVKTLKIEQLEGISLQCALIFYKNNVAIDTVYSDQFLEYWQIGKFVYKDTSGFFEQKFAHFFNKNNW